MPDKLNIEQFAAKIREHRPDLASVPMDVLVGKTLAAAPELKEFVDLSAEANVKPVEPRKYVGRDATPWETASDQAAEVLKGMGSAVNPANIAGGLAGAAGAGWNMLTKSGPEKYGPAMDLVKTLASPLTTSLRGLGALVAPHSVQAPTEDAWKSAAQGSGALLVGSELPNALSPLANALSKVLPSKARAGGNLNTVMEKAKDVPLDLSNATAATDRAVELSNAGSSMPKVMRDFLRNQKPTTGDFAGTKVSMSPDAMTYETGRDFASNAGRLSASEKLATNPQMGAQVAKFADAMSTANREAAASVGMGDLYDAAMKEYRQASSIGNAADVLKKWTARAGLAAALGGFGKAGYDIYSKVTH